ncbi:lysosomal alpha-mannosidase-like [Ostrinia nubilalis]|uniref:lysosomal alpha-mannosidase-like n=1 Tax=Ostrinia nubilalis TaxID=29057 RepID=UPI0030823752
MVSQNPTGAETDIYTHKLFDGYWSPPGFCFGTQCSDPLIITSTDDFTNVRERVNVFLQSVQFRQAPYYTTRNVMVMMGQRWGYYDASVWFANIDKLIGSLNRYNLVGGVAVNAFYSTPACYLKAVYEENPKLQTKQDDFFPFAYDKSSYATGMYSSRPALKYLAREGHRILQISKQLHVTARMGNYNKLFEDMSWINGVFQDHNIISGALRPHVMDYYVDKMASVIDLAMTTIIKNGLNVLRKSPAETNYNRCHFNISRCPYTGGPHYFIVVYNPLAWNVSTTVRLPIQPIDYTVYTPRGTTVRAAMAPIPDNVRRHPARKTRAFYELIFYAEDIPPMGFRSYCIQKSTLGWDRPKRSLIKKINQNKPKKYLVRQTNPSTDDVTLFGENEPEYMEYDESTTPRLETKIVFGNVSKIDYESRFTGVLTPKSRIEAVSSTTESITTKTTTETTERTTERVSRTTRKTESEDEEDINRDLYKHVSPKGYIPKDSRNPYFNNKYIRVNLDSKNRIYSVLLANGVKIHLDIKMFFYVSDDPDKKDKKMNSPGAYLFRTMDEKQEEINDIFNVTVYKTGLHYEYHCKLADYAAYVVRLYANSSVLEVDWMVGPVSVEDGLETEEINASIPKR